MKNILITGGFGYLGSRLATYLNFKGYNIFLGTRNLNYKNSWDSGFNIKLINWESEKSINESCNNMDIVIHTAGTNAFDSQMNPVTALQVNGINTGKLMQASILHFVNQFIYISTAHVYDSPLVGFINEDSCLKNQHPYATSHRAGEEMVNSLAKNKEIDLKILRLSNSFGFPVHKDVNAWMLIVNDVCKQLILNKGLVKLSSSGNQQRDFIPIENVNIIISKMIEFPKLFQGNSIFNIGSGQSMSILDITKIICERYQMLFNSEYQIEVDNSKELPSQFLEFNCDRIKHIIKDLSEHFLYEIDETLIFVYKHFNN